jgi:2-methylcitrate dehydratase PrpD
VVSRRPSARPAIARVKWRIGRLITRTRAEIEIETFARALTLNNDLAPASLEAAQYSIPFCVALAAVHGAETLLPVTTQSLQDGAVAALARRVTLSVDGELDRMFSQAVPARVTVVVPSGRFTTTVLAPKGEPANPLAWDELRAKFDAVARPRVTARGAAALVAGIEALERGDIAPLQAALAMPSVTSPDAVNRLLVQPAMG